MQLLISLETNNNVMQMSSFMFLYTNYFQILSFFAAIFGTTTLLRKIGVLRCILIMPVVTCVLALVFFFYQSLGTLFFIMIVMRGLQYGFNVPVREVLYIPTTRDIQFKSKAWIDSFGKNFSKSTGALVNLFAVLRGTSLCIAIETSAIFVITFIWIVIAFLVGKKYVKTIESNKVIGMK